MYGIGGPGARPPIEPGRKAMIQNLESRIELNGSQVVIKKILDNGRVVVEIPSAFEGLKGPLAKLERVGKEVIAVLPDKLEVIWGSTGAPGVPFDPVNNWGQGDECPICRDSLMNTTMGSNRTASVMSCCGGKMCGNCFLKIMTGDDPDRCPMCRADTSDSSDDAGLLNIMKRANMGNPNACYNLGGFYDYGKMGLRQDQTTARKWYKKGALNGECRAANNLACSYRDGEGGPVDLKEAARFFRMAAEGGHVAAGTNLGIAYMSGNGVPQDFKEAEKWLQASANAGDELAVQQLGMVNMMKRFSANSM